MMGRGRNARLVTPMKDRVWQNSAIMLVNHKKPPDIMTGQMVRLTALFYFSPPASWPKKKRAEAFRNTTLRPVGNEGDLDNLIASVMNLLQLPNVGYLKDDKDVVSMVVDKFFGEPERIELEIRVYE